MSQHPNARLTPRGRELLASRVAGGERVSAVARQMGVSRQTASKWLSRARRGEPLSDRPSRPRRLARSTHYSLSRPSGRLFCISPHSGNTMVSTPRGRWPTAPSRGRGGGLRGALVHAPPPARARRRDGRAGEDVRADRREEGASEARRRRSRHGRGPSPRARHARALRAREARRAPPRGREEGRPHPRRRRVEGARRLGARPRQGLRRAARGLPARRGRRLLVFSQVLLSEKSEPFFRVSSRKFFGFRRGHAASFLTCPA